MKTGASKFQNVTNDSKSVITNIIILAVLFSLSSCSPFICDMQSASLAGKHQVEITPGVSSVQFSQEPNIPGEQVKENISTVRGMQVAYGVSDKMDVRVRVERFEYRNETVTAFSVGPKFMLVKDRIALFTPIWFLGGTPVATQPTLLFSFPIVKNKIEFNPSVKNIISLGGYAPSTGILVAWKVGFAISTDLSAWAIRPEYGVVYDVNEKSSLSNYSLGLSLNLSKMFGVGR